MDAESCTSAPRRSKATREVHDRVYQHPVGIVWCEQTSRCHPLRSPGPRTEGCSSIAGGVKSFLLPAAVLRFRCELAFDVPRGFVE